MFLNHAMEEKEDIGKYLGEWDKKHKILPIQWATGSNRVNFVKKCIEYATDEKYQEIQPHTYRLHSRDKNGVTAIQHAIAQQKYEIVCII